MDSTMKLSTHNAMTTLDGPYQGVFQPQLLVHALSYDLGRPFLYYDDGQMLTAGGYGELIEHGTNGFLFDTQVEAGEYLDTLRADPALARGIGRAARSTVVDRFGHEHIERVCRFFLQPPDQRQ